MREALSSIKNVGFDRAIFESNSLQVVHALQKRVADISEFGVLIKDCLSLLQRETYFSIALPKGKTM